jgi:hypothetical protein
MGYYHPGRPGNRWVREGIVQQMKGVSTFEMNHLPLPCCCPRPARAALRLHSPGFLILRRPPDGFVTYRLTRYPMVRRRRSANNAFAIKCWFRRMSWREPRNLAATPHPLILCFQHFNRWTQYGASPGSAQLLATEGPVANRILLRALIQHDDHPGIRGRQSVETTRTARSAACHCF